MVDVAQDITYYSYADSSYAFILTPQGYTIMHPSFQRPLRTSIQPMHTDIRHFEQHAGFHAVREAILSRDRGEMMLHVGVSNVTQLDSSSLVVERRAKYVWRKVEDIPFIVVIKTYYDAREAQKQLKNILMSNQPDSDRMISDHVLRMHRYRAAGEQDGDGGCCSVVGRRGV